MRWAKGYLQVFGKYGTRLLRGVFRKNGFACFDMCMTIMPAIILTAISLVANLAGMVLSFWSAHDFLPTLLSALQAAVGAGIVGSVLGPITKKPGGKDES